MSEDEKTWHDQQEGKDRDKYKDFLTRLTFPDRSRNSKQWNWGVVTGSHRVKWTAFAMLAMFEFSIQRQIFDFSCWKIQFFFPFDLYFKLKRFFWYRKYEIASSSRPIFETKASTSRPKFLKPRLRLLPIVTEKKWKSLDAPESQDESSHSENQMCSFIYRKVSKLPYLPCIVSISVCIGGVNS